MIYVILSVLVIYSIFLTWFSYKSLRNNIFISEEILELQERLLEFRNHLDIIYGLEEFYGDEIIKNLLKHSRSLSVYVDSFGDVTNLELPELNEDELTEIKEDEQENNDRKIVDRKVVIGNQ